MREVLQLLRLQQQLLLLPCEFKQVAQLSQTDRAAAWVSCGANINVLHIQRTLL